MAAADPPLLARHTHVRALVPSLADKLHNPFFGQVCRALEGVVDMHARKTGSMPRIMVLTQSEDGVRLAVENYARLDSEMLMALRKVIPDENYHYMEVLRPCERTQTPHTPVTVAIQVGTSQQVVCAEVPRGTPLTSTANLRKLGIPETLELTVQRLLDKLTNGGGMGATPLHGVSFSKKHSTLVVPQPPTYSYDFLMSLFSEFQRVLEDFRFETVSLEDGKPPTSVVALQLRDYSGAEAGGYVRNSGRARGSFLSRFNPFAS